MPIPEIQRLLDSHKSLSFDENTEKVKCSLTNHEMPAKVSAIESYVNGKKYKRLSDLEALDYEDHKMHIVPNDKKKKENEMFCRLTLRHLEKTSKAIQRHINGRKYKNSLARWNECKKTGAKFIAHIRRRAKGPDDSDDESVVSTESGDDAKEEEVHDDMSDLYPEADFQEENDSGDGMEVEDNVPTENVPPKFAKTKTKNKKKVGEKNKGATGKVKKGKSNDDKSSGAKKRSIEQNGKEHARKKKIKK